jgi:hypothetical protein
MEYNLVTLHLELPDFNEKLYSAFLPWETWFITEGLLVPLAGLGTWSIL